MVEKQSGFQIKVLRSDNAKEFTSAEFSDFCSIHGLIHQLSTPYTPQQNGVAERKNRFLLEMARCMMIEKNVPRCFWAEAVNTAVYLQNRLPTRTFPKRTPYEAWFGYKPSIKHLRVFGSLCFVQVPDAKRKKLDDKAIPGVFMGYSSVSKAYRIYDPELKVIMVSRDVIVDEDACWPWNDEAGNNAEEHLSFVPTQSFPVPNLQESQQQGFGGEVAPASHSGNSTGDEHQSNVPSSSSSVPSPSISTGSSPVLRTRSMADIYTQATQTDPEDVGEGYLQGSLSADEVNESCLFVTSVEPSNFDEAMEHEDWRRAMQNEINSIVKNKTWSLVDLPSHKHAIGVKWVFRTKINPDGSVNKHKARLVVKGYAQEPGTDFGDTFSPVARLDTIKLLLALAAQNKWQVHHMDVKSAFLNGVLEEDIYVQQPAGFEVPGKEEKVYKLHKALYGLKQAPRAWYSRIDNWLLEQGFSRCATEVTLYHKRSSTDVLIVSVYVDDLLVTGDSEEQIKSFKAVLTNAFEMTDLNLMTQFLNMEVAQTEECIFVSQQSYTEKIMKRFGMSSCKPISTPLAVDKGKKVEADLDEARLCNESVFRSLIGSLLFLTSTRPDIVQAVHHLSRYMKAPTYHHFKMAKRVLRYLRGTSTLGIKLRKGEPGVLTGYSDSDFSGANFDGKCTSGYVFFIGSNCICWNSRKQDAVAQSTAEAEFIAAATAAKQALWLRKILFELKFLPVESTVMKVDNKAAIAITKNPVMHGRTKHMKLKYHFLRELEKEKEISLEFCPTEDQLADIFTKSLPKARFESLRSNLGVVNKLQEEIVEDQVKLVLHSAIPSS